jgi:methionyl-tRNA synthetase
MITYDEFSKIDLRIGKVLEVVDHPNADKLYVLKVDIGEKEIQLVAGLRQHCSIEDLQGKKIVVLTNLEPRAVRGVESQGMLLAAQSDDLVTIINPQKDIAPGSIIR